MNEQFPEQEKKNVVEARIEEFVTEKGLAIVARDFEKPWGGYFVIADEDTKKFIQLFFSEHAELFINQDQKLSPKILVVQAGNRLSWQYHDRRTEFHKVIEGPVAYPLSETDDQPEAVVHQQGDLIQIPQGTRHRLVGLGNWGVVAEIWQHTDVENPSNEADNHRVQDDYNRA